MRMDKKFCQNLKAARAQSGMTQKQIATLLGVVESCYANWEQGRTEPSVTMLRALCNTLNVTADELLNGELNISVKEIPLRIARRGFCFRSVLF